MATKLQGYHYSLLFGAYGFGIFRFVCRMDGGGMDRLLAAAAAADCPQIAIPCVTVSKIWFNFMVPLKILSP